MFGLTGRSRDDDGGAGVRPEAVELWRIREREQLKIAILGHLEPHGTRRGPPFRTRRDGEEGIQRAGEQSAVLIAKHEI
jgi:hypothetical protein